MGGDGKGNLLLYRWVDNSLEDTTKHLCLLCFSNFFPSDVVADKKCHFSSFALFAGGGRGRAGKQSFIVVSFVELMIKT